MNTDPICTYCAMDATYRDHVPPFSSYSGVKRSASFSLPGVWACAECNYHLGDRPLNTTPERAGYLFKRLTAKYQKLLRSPSWTPEELADMGPKLRRAIQAAQKERHLVSIRLANLKGLAP